MSRDLAAPDTVVSPMPTAALLLGEGHDLNMQVCEGFFRDVRSTGDVMKADPFTNIVRTFWLQRTKTVHADCASRLSDYDYARASAVAERLGVDKRRFPAFLLMSPNGLDGLVLYGDRLDEDTADDFAVQWIAEVSAAALEVPMIRSEDSSRPVSRSVWQHVACGLFSFAAAFFGGDGDNVAEWLNDNVYFCRRD